MKRHPALVPLSHDHHHALVRARELREAGGDTAVAERFLRFFDAETVRHFREEEELVFPLLLADADEPPEELVRALVQHGRLHALAEQLRTAPDEATMLETGTLLEEHIRLEERVLFELVQERVADDRLRELELGPRPLTSGEGPGPVWGTESADLNATVVVWAAGEGSPDHVNDERDVLFVFLAGGATVEVDGERQVVGSGDALVIPKGAQRRVDAGPRGVRYLTAHLRRGGLTIRSLAK